MFIERCQTAINDELVSPRYRFGELRLTRLNFWVAVFLFKSRYHQVEWQYGAYFAQYYAPILFLFAVFSLLLSAMQVVLAVQPVLEVNDSSWLAFATVSRGFSVFTIFLAVFVALLLLSIFLVSVLGELLYAVKDILGRHPPNQANADQENQVGNGAPGH